MKFRQTFVGLSLCHEKKIVWLTRGTSRICAEDTVKGGG